MSTHLHAEATGNHPARPAAPDRPSPTDLRAGSFVYLWPPNEADGVGARPVLARVERTTTDVILARDLATGVRCQYEVGPAYPAGLRWGWELAAPPESPCLTRGTPAVVDKNAMTWGDRQELLFGTPGSTVRISTRAGESYTGVPTLAVVDGDDSNICWVRIAGPTDSRGEITYMVRFADITAVVLGGGR